MNSGGDVRRVTRTCTTPSHPPKVHEEEWQTRTPNLFRGHHRGLCVLFVFVLIASTFPAAAFASSTTSTVGNSTATQVVETAADLAVTATSGATLARVLMAISGFTVKALTMTAKACFGAYVATGALLFAFQRKMLYIPNRDHPPLQDLIDMLYHARYGRHESPNKNPNPSSSPSSSSSVATRRRLHEERFARLEDVAIDTRDGETIRAYYWPGPEQLLSSSVEATNAAAAAAAAAAAPKLSEVMLLMFHGNAGNRCDRLLWMDQLRSALGCGICMVDYRGYGGSSGKPSEKGFLEDARAADLWLRTRLAKEQGRLNSRIKIVLYGESIGTGVISWLAGHGEEKPDAVILQAPFTSAADAGQALFPYFPVKILMRDKFSSIEWCKKWHKDVPACVIHGTQDEIVPYKLGKELYDKIPVEDKVMISLQGAHHNDIPEYGIEYLQPLYEFLLKVDDRARQRIDAMRRV